MEHSQAANVNYIREYRFYEVLLNMMPIIFPRISLHCKLVPVQYREYECGLLPPAFFLIFFLVVSFMNLHISIEAETINNIQTNT